MFGNKRKVLTVLVSTTSSVGVSAGTVQFSTSYDGENVEFPLTALRTLKELGVSHNNAKKLIQEEIALALADKGEHRLALYAALGRFKKIEQKVKS